MLMVLLTLYICKRPPDPNLGLQQCGANLHKIGVALEKFRLSSEDGRYPAKLDEAFKGTSVPACPVGGDEAYLQGYQPGADRLAYLQVCKGSHHKTAGVPLDYPRIAFGPAEAAASGEKSTEQGTVPSALPTATAIPQATPVAGQETPKAGVSVPATATPNS
jgi:hypothetical protein